MSAFFHRVVKNSIWTGVGSAGSALLNVLFAGLTVRWLGLGDAGFVLAMTTLTSMTAGIAGLGFGAAGIRYLAEAQARKDDAAIRRIVGTLVGVSITFGLLILVILLLGAPWLIRWAKYAGDPNTARLFCGLIGLAVALRHLSGCMMTILEAYQRYDFLTTRNLAFDLASGLLGIFVLRAWPTILTSGMITASLAIVNFTVLARLVARQIGFLPIPAWNGTTFFSLWRLGRWTYLTSIGTMLLDQMDRVLMTSLFGSAALPLYTMGKRGYEISHQILVGQAAYLFPMLCGEGDAKIALMDRIEPKIRWFISVLSIWLYSTMILLGPPVLDLLVGKHFGTRISLYILIFSFVGIIHAQSIVPWNFAYALDRVRLVTLFQVGSSLGVLIPMYFLGRLFGFTGAICGQFGIAISVVLFYAALWKNVALRDAPLRIFQPMMAPLAFYVIALLAWLYVGPGLAVRLACGAACGVLFLPLVVRLERLLFPASEAPATLRRAAERVTRGFPSPAMTMIFGRAA